MTAAMLERVHVGTAHRVTMHAARRHFAAGGTVLVSDRGHELELPVTDVTTVHTRDTVSWDDLAGMVTTWRNRYPNQRFYIVTYAPNTCTFPPDRVPIESVRPGDILPAIGAATVDRVEYVPATADRIAVHVVHYVPGARSRYSNGRMPLAYSYVFTGERVYVSRQVTR